MTDTAAPTGAEATTATAHWVADHLAILNLIARVAQLTDGGELSDYERLWTQDCAWEFPGAPRHGRAEIVESARGRRSRNEGGPGSNTRHVITTTWVGRIEGDEAEADSYWMFWADTATAPVLRLMGRYHDTFRRGPDGWQIARREIAFG